MYYTFKDFHFKVNKNIIYLCCKCYIRNDGIEKLYKTIETNKAFDLSKDLSKIKINSNKSEMLLIEQLDYQQYANYIFIFVPDDKHVIVIPVEGITSVFNNSLIDFQNNF